MFLPSQSVRFAHFFASPLLDESSLDREIEAVDSGECVHTLTSAYHHECTVELL